MEFIILSSSVSVGLMRADETAELELGADVVVHDVEVVDEEV